MGKMIYIRTDKNGTKIYHDYTCRRCGGAGGADKWAYTGWTCYECGGSGETPDKPDVIKEYTPEYRAKLDARAKAREEKRLAKQLEKFNNERQQMIMDLGFDSDGKCYVTYGNTYPVKDQLKEENASWRFGHWILDHATELAPYVIIEADEVLDIIAEYGTISWKHINEVEEVINSKIKATEPVKTESNFVGEVGDKVELELTFQKRFSYETTFGYRTTTNYIYSFLDDDGNVIVWKTTSWNEDLFVADRDFQNPRVIVTGSIKAHDVYKGIKQTSLQRCKISLK